MTDRIHFNSARCVKSILHLFASLLPLTVKQDPVRAANRTSR
jgi:hypothetical protein